MPSQNEIELIKIYKASQEKYIYFLMAAAGSGIGFAVVQTKIEKLATHHWLWGLALLLWSLSFLCGMQFLEHHNSATYQNANYLGFTRDLTKCSPEIRLEYKDNEIKESHVFNQDSLNHNPSYESQDDQINMLYSINSLND